MHPMGFTLVVGRDDDLCCKLIRNRLEAAGREIVYLPEDELFPGLHFVWELQNGKSRGSVGFAKQPVRFDQIDSVFARFSGITTSAEEHRTRDGQYLNSEWHALARGYMQSLPCPVINRLRSELWYKSRLCVPDLVSLLPNLRFHLPKTMVTTRYEDARAFFALCGGRVRYSPLSLPSNYVLEEEAEMEKLAPLSKIMPLNLTEIVRGDSVRAFVVGRGVVFDGEPNETAASACLEAAASLDLSFCEFELIRSTDGEWYCFALNCAPYLFQCGDEARAAVIDRLFDALCARNERKAA
jgi:hypothetical protein